MCAAVEDVHHVIYDQEPNKSCHENLNHQIQWVLKLGLLVIVLKKSTDVGFVNYVYIANCYPRAQKIPNKKL